MFVVVLLLSTATTECPHIFHCATTCCSRVRAAMLLQICVSFVGFVFAGAAADAVAGAHPVYCMHHHFTAMYLLKMKPLQSCIHCLPLLGCCLWQCKRFVACTCVIRAKQTIKSNKNQNNTTSNNNKKKIKIYNFISNDNAIERVASKRHVTFLSISECVRTTKIKQFNIENKYIDCMYSGHILATLYANTCNTLPYACNMQTKRCNTLKTWHYEAICHTATCCIIGHEFILWHVALVRSSIGCKVPSYGYYSYSCHLLLLLLMFICVGILYDERVVLLLLLNLLFTFSEVVLVLL